MRQITIDFTSQLHSCFAGYIGEHNATEITVVRPADLSGVMYSLAFMTNGEVIHSKYFSADEEIKIALWQQLTLDNDLYVQLEAFDENGDYLGKSTTAKLTLLSSVHGTDMIADADNPDVYSEIALNSWFRETLEDNADTLDKLTTSENGELLFDGKPIEGGGGEISVEVIEQIEANTEARHTHNNKETVLDLLTLRHNRLLLSGYGDLAFTADVPNPVPANDINNYFGSGNPVRNGYIGSEAVEELIDQVKARFATKELVEGLGSPLKLEIVEALPETGEENTIYLVPSGNTKANIYEEYLFVNSSPELIGSTAINLSDYYTKTETDETFAKKTDIPTKTSELENDIGFITASHKDKDYGIYDFQNYVDGYLDASGELATTLKGFVTSDYIPVVPNKEYTISACRYIAYYDFDKNFISQETKGKGIQDVVVPNNAYYVRITWFEDQDWNLAFVGKGKSIPYLPPYIYGVVGKEINLYFDGLGLDDYKLYTYDFSVKAVNSSNPTGQDERIVFNPTTAGAYLMNLTVYKDGECVGTCKSYLTVRNENAASGVSKTALIIGDSLVAQNHYVTELYNLFDADEANLTLIGTKGTAPYLHEGISGASTNTFLNGNTPFKNPDTGKFDFAYYMNQNLYSGVDYVIFNLGINDIFYADTVEEVETKTQAVVDNLTEMIASIQTYNASTVVCVNVTIPPSYSQDAFGNNYGVSPLRWTYRRAYNRLIEKIIDAFKFRDSRHQYLNPVNVNLDTEHNMQVEEVAVNSRNTQTVKRQSNGVHPAECGYYQMADVTYYTLKFLSDKYSA